MKQIFTSLVIALSLTACMKALDDDGGIGPGPIIPDPITGSGLCHKINLKCPSGNGIHVYSWDTLSPGLYEGTLTILYNGQQTCDFTRKFTESEANQLSETYPGAHISQRVGSSYCRFY